MPHSSLDASIQAVLTRLNKASLSEIEQQELQRRSSLVERHTWWGIAAVVVGIGGSYPFLSDLLLRYFLFTLATLCFIQAVTVGVASREARKRASAPPSEPNEHGPKLRRVV